jgi:hypothetical protein
VSYGPKRFAVALLTNFNVIPTIRKPGSEIWISFNPELETDDTISGSWFTRRRVLS